MVEGLSVEDEDVIFWDRKVSGFGVRVYPSGKKTYVVQTRAFGRSKRVTIGRNDDLSLHKAREIGAEIIARIKKGQPPFPEEPTPEPTVADLAERYMREYVELHCKPVTVSHYRGILRKHIVPALGELLVRAVTHGDILAFHTGLYGVPTLANRAVDLLGHMFRLADQWEWRPSGRNPCEGVPRYKVEQLRERFLTREELARLGAALRVAPAERLASTHAAAAIRLLVLTGCRRNEILGLRWDDLNFETGEMRLSDSKTGTRMLPLTPRRREGVRRPRPHAQQSVGVSGPEKGRSSGQPQRFLGTGAQACGTRRRPPARPPSHVRLARPRPRIQPADDRGPARSHHGEHPRRATPISKGTRFGRPPPTSPRTSPRESCRPSTNRAHFSVPCTRLGTPPMRSPNKLVLTIRNVEALPEVDRETVFWDRDLTGFGVRVYPSGSKVYMVHTRGLGKSRRVHHWPSRGVDCGACQARSRTTHRKHQGRRDPEAPRRRFAFR